MFYRLIFPQLFNNRGGGESACGGMASSLIKRNTLPGHTPPHKIKISNFDIGGGERVRTDGLLRARQALSQLSYTPESIADLGLQVYHNSKIPMRLWWAWMELNHRPHAYQACALTKLSYRPL